MGSHINSPANVDFIEVCGDQIIRERLVHKAMQEKYKRKDKRSRKSKPCMDRESVEVLIFLSKRVSNNAC